MEEDKFPIPKELLLARKTRIPTTKETETEMMKIQFNDSSNDDWETVRVYANRLISLVKKEEMNEAREDIDYIFGIIEDRGLLSCPNQHHRSVETREKNIVLFAMYIMVNIYHEMLHSKHFTPACFYRCFITSLMVATKINLDVCYSNKFWGKCFDFATDFMNTMEVELFFKCKINFAPTREMIIEDIEKATN